MNKGQEYFCTLKPIDPYFFGGERTFRFGESTNYFIVSEKLPQQSTLMGMIRYIMLAKEGLLNDGYQSSGGEKKEKQRALIGSRGFRATEHAMSADYGKLYGISPVFLVKEANGHRNRMIPTPLNHKAGKEKYHPFAMKAGFRTEAGNDALLPQDYVAKDGLAASYLQLDDSFGTTTSESDIFGTQEHTRIGRGVEEDGYFKMMYRYLKKDYCIGFYCRAEKGVLPQREVTYLGRGKSMFLFTSEETDGRGRDSMEARIRSLPGTKEAALYYAWSDVFFDTGSKEKDYFSYSITEKRLFRTLDTQESARNFRESRKESPLFQLIRSGSVFYVRPAKEQEFLKCLAQPGLLQAGFNCVVKLGGNAE